MSESIQMSAYELTMPLLISAKQKDQKVYSSAIEKILAQTHDPTSFNLWLLGRVIVAADDMGEKDRANDIAAVVHKQLLLLPKSDNFSTWTWGYLAAHYAHSKEYQECKENMLSGIEDLQAKTEEREQDNVQWAFALGISAAAQAKDAGVYRDLLQKLKLWTGKENLSDAIETIPRRDFTAWAMALIYRAAQKMDDLDSCRELAPRMQVAIASATAPNDQLLAQMILT